MGCLPNHTDDWGVSPTKWNPRRAGPGPPHSLSHVLEEWWRCSNPKNKSMNKIYGFEL